MLIEANEPDSAISLRASNLCNMVVYENLDLHHDHMDYASDQNLIKY